MSYAADFDKGGEDIAYALYDLARGGRAAIGDLRYYLEAKLDNFGSPLAKAQLGAALALYGDRTRASDGLRRRRRRARRRRTIRSASAPTMAASCATPPAVLALAAEFKPAGVDLARARPSQLGDLRDADPLDLDAGRCLDAGGRRRARDSRRRAAA